MQVDKSTIRNKLKEGTWIVQPYTKTRKKQRKQKKKKKVASTDHSSCFFVTIQ